MTFVFGFSSDHFIKKSSNKREKAREIDMGIMPTLKHRVEDLKSILENKFFITFSISSTSPPQAIFELDDEHILIELNESGIFQVQNHEIELRYSKDRILNKHGKKIIHYLKAYHSEIGSLKNIINSLNPSNIPDFFEISVRDLLKKQFGNDDLERGQRKEELLFILYSVAITGSYKSYTSGRTCVVNIIKEKPNGLQNILKKESK